MEKSFTMSTTSILSYLSKTCYTFSDDYVRNAAKDHFWYLDTNSTTANTNSGFEARKLLTQRIGEGGGVDDAPKYVSVIVGLNRFGIFEELEDKMLPPMQLQFNVELNDDNELIHKEHALAAGRVVIDKFILWVPKMIPKDSLMSQYIDPFMKPTTWSYLLERYDVSLPMRTSGFYQISASIENVRHVFVYLKNGYRNINDHRQVENSPYTLNTFNLPGGVSLANCRLE